MISIIVPVYVLEHELVCDYITMVECVLNHECVHTETDGSFQSSDESIIFIHIAVK